MGRPSIYGAHIVEGALEYIASCEDQIVDSRLKVKVPTIEGLALYLGIHKDTIYAWESEKNEGGEYKYSTFSDVIAQLRAKQADKLINNGLSGAYNPTIAKVLLTKHGYREGLDQTTNDKDLPIPIMGTLEKE